MHVPSIVHNRKATFKPGEIFSPGQRDAGHPAKRYDTEAISSFRSICLIRPYECAIAGELILALTGGYGGY